jgi:hypothetical protein
MSITQTVCLSIYLSVNLSVARAIFSTTTFLVLLKLTTTHFLATQRSAIISVDENYTAAKVAYLAR